MSLNPDSPEPRAPASNRLGRYELLNRIAVGGMGEVFLARERGAAGVNRIVVVKRLLPQLAEDPEQVALFIDEARITSQLAHPNIAQIYEFGVDDGVHFLAMEHVPGKDLAHLCERASRLGFRMSRDLAIYVVAEAARGLHFAHCAKDERGRPLDIVHRDVSPHNVLVSSHGDVKLMDFGIASAAIRRQRTRTGVLRGKFAYMSPEQAEQKDLDARSDIFSAGVLLWETTLGERLFAADTELETIRRVSEARIPTPRSIDPSYSEQLESIVMTALAFEPGDRFQSAAAFESALRSQLDPRAEPRVALGAWVSQLFPDVAKLEASSARVTGQVTATASPSSPAQGRQRRTAPTMDATSDERAVDALAPTAHAHDPRAVARTSPALESPASVVANMSTAPGSVAPAATTVESSDRLAFEPTTASRPAASHSQRRRSAWRIAAVALPAAIGVAVLSYVGVRSLRTADPERPPSAIAAEGPRDGGAAAPITGPATTNTHRGNVSDASISAAARPVVDAAGPIAHRPRVSHRRRTTTAAPASIPRVAPPDAGTVSTPNKRPDRETAPSPATVAAEPVTTKPRLGRLAVASTPWGNVIIDGKNYGPSDLQESLQPGPHTVMVRLSKGGGTVTTTAIVEEGKKTKCRAKPSSISCDSPR